MIEDLPYYFKILCFLPQIEFADNYFIQLAIKRIKELILTHFELLEPSFQHLQLVSFTFFIPSQVVSNISHASLATVMCEILWNSFGETPQKIAFKALLLALAAARVALSQVDLAAFGLVQPASMASQIVSLIEHKNSLIRTFQKA